MSQSHDGLPTLASDGACPSEDELVAMIEGALSAQELAAIERHVATCEACASVVGDLGALGDVGRGRAVDRYQLDRRIAAGGMGEVWAAWDPQLRREIAIKLVKPERSDEVRERERLLREARALARLKHPNVIAVHDVGEQDGEVFIVSELVTGDTLANRGGPSAEWRTIVRMYAQAARGLAAAHAAGLVHRDVKPANLLLGTDGRVRVADFGLAIRDRSPTSLVASDVSEASVADSITQRGHIAGTPAYMAPEQRAGATVGPAADQFALCVALGEAIAGRRPPMDSSQQELLAFVGERRAMEPELHQLCAVIARGLAIDASERFPDMASLGDALDALAPPIKMSGEHRVLSTRIPTPPVPTPVIARRRWSGTLVIAGVVIVAAVLAVVLLARGESAPAPPEPAVAPAPARDATVARDVPSALVAVRAAITRRDGAACLAELASVFPASPAPAQASDLASARAVCRMLAGECAAGVREQRAIDPAQADALADAYCPVDGDPDPAVRLRRLARQVDATTAHCASYLPHARAAGQLATRPDERASVGRVLHELVACFAQRGDCATARTIADEAAAFSGPAELPAACR